MKNAQMSPEMKARMEMARIQARIAELKAELEKTERRLLYKTQVGQKKGVENLLNKKARYLAEQEDLIGQLNKLMGVEDEDDD